MTGKRGLYLWTSTHNVHESFICNAKVILSRYRRCLQVQCTLKCMRMTKVCYFTLGPPDALILAASLPNSRRPCINTHSTNQTAWWELLLSIWQAVSRRTRALCMQHVSAIPCKYAYVRWIHINLTCRECCWTHCIAVILAVINVCTCPVNGSVEGHLFIFEHIHHTFDTCIHSPCHLFYWRSSLHL